MSLSVSQLIDEANRSSSIRSQAMREQSAHPPAWKLLYHLTAEPACIFWNRYVTQHARREGLDGLVRSVLAGWSHWLTWAKYWEASVHEGQR